MKKLLKGWFSKTNSSVFLGKVVVVERKDFKRHIDQWGMFEDCKYDTGLTNFLSEIFQAPLASNLVEQKKGDLVLDIIVPKHQSGDYWDISLGVVSFPVFWRPKLTLVSRLSEITTGKVQSTHRVSVSVSWFGFLKRVLTWKAFLRIEPIFGKEDMEELLLKACKKLIGKMEASR